MYVLKLAALALLPTFLKGLGGGEGVDEVCRGCGQQEGLFGSLLFSDRGFSYQLLLATVVWIESK